MKSNQIGKAVIQKSFRNIYFSFKTEELFYYF